MRWNLRLMPMVGGGLEIRPADRRLGFRIALEDYLLRYDRYDILLRPTGQETGHQISVKVGVVF